ncbi:hypothetical protein D3C86_2115190 [compost metagenome]
MAARWQAVAQNFPVAETFRFTLAIDGQKPTLMAERNMLMMADKDRPVIVAFWSEENGGLFQPTTEEEG